MCHAIFMNCRGTPLCALFDYFSFFNFSWRTMVFRLQLKNQSCSAISSHVMKHAVKFDFRLICYVNYDIPQRFAQDKKLGRCTTILYFS